MYEFVQDRALKLLLPGAVKSVEIPGNAGPEIEHHNVGVINPAPQIGRRCGATERMFASAEFSTRFKFLDCIAHKNIESGVVEVFDHFESPVGFRFQAGQFGMDDFCESGRRVNCNLDRNILTPFGDRGRFPAAAAHAMFALARCSQIGQIGETFPGFPIDPDDPISLDLRRCWR
ncbi:MAG: hypothetical protein OXG77_02420 [Chloroflexi bacterium]|nr:hypothetical protein [Chloroflexota bacterium]